MRWFAAGLGFTVAGGITQALAIVFSGQGMPAGASMAFLPGTMLEALGWAIALGLRFRSERAALLDQLVQEADQARCKCGGLWDQPPRTQSGHRRHGAPARSPL